MSLAALRPALLAALIAIGAPAPSHAADTPGIAWQAAASDADVDKAFAQARAGHKPLLLYWGAKWCPPCNQLRATLFNRQDFVERSRAFVAVSIDGDLPGAQKLGSRFKVRGYPTMILFNGDGQEITRLPGEVDAAQVMQVLQLGLANGRPVKTVLADAKAGKPLDGNEWRLLAFYSWDTDEQQLVPQAQRPALLAKLAAACPASEAAAATRLQLKALAEAEEGKLPQANDAQRDKVRQLLADPAASRAQMDVITNWAPDIVKALAGDDARQRDGLVRSFDTALQRLQADTSLSRADRLTALMARVDLARLQAGVADDAKVVKLPPALLKEVRDAAAREDREITDGYERQAVITTAAHTLHRTGLDAESDALLKANLGKSHSPYYLMSQLAGNAKARGDKAEALRWYEQAFNKSEGPATRLQWGASYVSALVELAPQDGTRIERAVQQLLDEAAAQPNAFYERSARSLQKVGAKLQAWNAKGQHAAAMQRLQARLGGVCAKLDAADPQRATCEGLLKAAPGKTA
ncbi:thioredoxin family protein [Ideonella sp. BN130291]|uniref:thioredoxin family protein n=1 Tax=Ideonella sp. BN130291 TaxID=3112940 RepID=UPI002E26F36B|nr:thioredoxin family protein [Ideonella sp. BN130291]